MTPIADGGFGVPRVLLLFGFIVAVNLGGNILPQGAAADMMTLKVARDRGVENFSFKRLLKTGASFAFIHIGVACLYLLILTPFFIPP